MRFERIRTRLLGWAFILGPLLMVVSTGVLLAGIGRNPGVTEYGSSVEGVVGFYGFILLTPVFLHLASRLGTTRPRLGAIALVTGLLGFAGGGAAQMTLRVMTGVFQDAGVTEAAFEVVQSDLESGRSLAIFVIAMGPLIPLTSILIGIGFLLERKIRAQASLLVAAGILIPIGQLIGVATDLTYTLGLAAWAIALVPMGVRIVGSQQVVDHGLSATATAGMP